MEKKKVLKGILVIVLIIVAIYVGNVLRKMVIISELQSKLDKYQMETNIYKRTYSDYSSGLTSYERYYKDGVNKEVMTRDENYKITQFTYADKRKTFFDAPAGNVYREYNESNNNVYYPVFIDYLTTRSVPELFLFAKHKFTTEELDGKECYVINGNNIPNMMIEAEAIETKAYIEKDTGILVQIKSVVEENGNKEERTIKYEYSIGTVTDEDMKEPNMKDYKVVQD